MGQIDQKIAIVTGSDSGIGSAIAIQFANEGATFFIEGGLPRTTAGL
ncbi:hypothetical protein [Dictyobacter kobayashii]|uniref:Uncharacterized protein n=1 Tax=Dictyobacter kobayashii TaxID=2014872 RepID=A0A402ADF4_9CHLR|nr:hypothetical protein [Dictyobacter kobayashii]GCE17134.1 hypothetical protein KDK_09340 [Dictyobacter kobayashii]